ncbi:uncharacterized protein B0T15DRAFT_535896 [Chaetomium strumarium]|uniref:Golgi to ER traffic protein 2 n=1 Tax=Chaetomium strumarium TaxID=1170767 RepID=A0AAJ0GQX5_9PEZI|nr:hypothetical protein B0T15DRAFT_535896 [Chaetomium strumarium]
MTPEEEAAAAARAEEQIRLRKARREAKIKAGAESRLKTITGLGGGVQRDPAPAATRAPAPSTTASSAPASVTPLAAQVPHADPEEVDISQHFYQPRTTARVPPSNGTTPPSMSESQLRQIMLGLDQPTPPGTGAGTPAMPMPGMGGMEDDPMMRMMMQMLGGGNNSSNNPFAGFPPSQLGSQPQQAQQANPTLPSRSASLYRLLHTLIALALGLYIALYTPFTGTKLGRDRAAAAAAGSAEEREHLLHHLQYGLDGTMTKNFFWAFATAEALLLTSRYFMDRGRSRLESNNGMLGMLAGFLPRGVRSKVETAMRYGEVLGTVRRDVLVCVFVLGVAAWWRA